MIRAICVLALINAALDHIIMATGGSPGILPEEFRWIYWLFAVFSIGFAIRVAVKGTE